jgi:hypothetical protein
MPRRTLLHLLRPTAHPRARLALLAVLAAAPGALHLLGCKDPPPPSAPSSSPSSSPSSPGAVGDPPPAPVATPAPDAAAPPRALAAAQALKGELRKELEAAMKDGPAAAIDVCAERAPAIAAAHSVEGLAVGRTSHKLRNPQNAPRPWVKLILDEMVAADPATLVPRVVALEGGRTGYIEPILTQPLCVTCHGAAVAPELKEKIAARYPADQATGFEPGTLRGLVWAELDADAARAAPAPPAAP